MNSPVKTGNMVNSDGDVYNMVDLLKSDSSTPVYIDSGNALNNQPAMSGNFINGEGNVENLVDILISKASSAPTPLYTDDNNTLNTQPAISGNMVDSNNEVYNIVDLIKDGGGGSSSGGWVAKYALVSGQDGLDTPLVSNNMTLECYSYSDGYMKLKTQLFKNDEDLIQPSTLFLKDINSGGNLVGYEDDGSAVNLNLYALHPDGQSHEIYIDFEQPNLTADGTLGGAEFACSADSVVDGNRLAWKAFDGDTVMVSIYTDMWHSGSGQPHWLEFYNPNPLIVYSITIFNSMDTVVPWEWKFQYSDDDTTWTDCASGTNTEWAENGEWSFNVTNSGEHKYYRFYTISSHGSTPDYVGITELQITGVEHKEVVVDKYKYVLAKDSTFELPEGYDGSVLVGKIYLPAHYYNDNGSWQMGTGGEEPVDDNTPVLRSLTVTPTTSPQTIMPDNDIDGYAPVYVEAFNGYTEFPRYVVSNGTASTRTGALPNNFLSGVTSIGSYALYSAFQRCAGITGAVDLSNITYIDSYGMYNAFQGCTGITSVDLTGLTGTVWQSSLSNAFSGCTGITGSIDLSGITTIKTGGMSSIFNGCTGITGVDLSNVTTIESQGLISSFSGCTNLTGAVDLSKVTSIGGSGLSSTFKNTKITSLDISSVNDLPQSVMSQMCQDCTYLTSVDLSGVTSFSGTSTLQAAFQNCSALTSFSFGTAENIKGGCFNNTFKNCTSLQTIDLSGVTGYLKENATLSHIFEGCTSLTSVDLSGITSIEYFDTMKEICKGCTALQTVDLSGVTQITGNTSLENAFKDCTSLTSVDLSSVTQIEANYPLNNAFDGCSSLSTMEFSELTTTGSSSAFQNAFKNSGLETLRLPKWNTSSSNAAFYFAFYDCPRLKDLYFNSLTPGMSNSASTFVSAFNSNTGSTSGGFTLHFPSNMATKVATFYGYPNFGADSNLITLAFDLPATA